MFGKTATLGLRLVAKTRWGDLADKVAKTPLKASTSRVELMVGASPDIQIKKRAESQRDRPLNWLA